MKMLATYRTIGRRYFVENKKSSRNSKAGKELFRLFFFSPEVNCWESQGLSLRARDVLGRAEPGEGRVPGAEGRVHRVVAGAVDGSEAVAEVAVGRLDVAYVLLLARSRRGRSRVHPVSEWRNFGV